MPNSTVDAEILRHAIVEFDRKLAAADQCVKPISLSERERQILILFASGYDNAQIAVLCSIAVQTVKNHRTSIFDKLNAQSAPHAVALALKLHLISIEDIDPL